MGGAGRVVVLEGKSEVGERPVPPLSQSPTLYIDRECVIVYS